MGITVAKFGSKTVSGEKGVNKNALARSANMLADRVDSGLIVVTSGAMAVGRALWLDRYQSRDFPGDQSLAMMGSAKIADAWRDAFARHGILTGQLLVTEREMSDQQERSTLQNALQDNFGNHIVPIVNQNDALSVKELAQEAFGGENDGLTVCLAKLVSAETIHFNTSEGGIRDDAGKLMPLILPKHFEPTRAMLLQRMDSTVEERSGIVVKFDRAVEGALEGRDVCISEAGVSIEQIQSGESGTYIPAVAKAAQLG